jgi:general stress protein YciG
MANTSKRGFASMDASKQREIASKGGRAAHAKGTAHEFTSDEARVAGRKGGEAVSRDRAHMSAIGREGGHSRGRTRQPGVSGNNGGSDTERQNYIGVGNDRGTVEESNRNTSSPRAESGNDFRGDDSATRRSL